MNTKTPRVFIAATRQNDGKTTNSLGLLAALQARFGRVGYIKPVGQRFVEIDAEKIDEDSVLMDRVFRLNCPLVDMSPIAVEPDFTRKYLQAANYETLVKRIHKAFDRVAWEKEFVLCEGTGHAGVGSVFDLSNATVARLLNAKVIIVTRGGIGLPIDEVTLNCALFEREGVEVIGVILNKVLPGKLDYISEFAEKGLRRKGLKLLGVVPHQPILSCPTLELVREELSASTLNESDQIHNIIENVVIGAMGPARAEALLAPGVLLIVPADRDDIIRAAGDYLKHGGRLAGIALSDDIAPSGAVLRMARGFPCPVLLTPLDSYTVASRVHDLIVKIRPGDTEKIRLVRDLIAHHVHLDRILEAIGVPAAPENVTPDPAA
ncbi:MAG: AAA family ATPase [Verrucomicrobiae bacterium]|nr:AAA family ATPase [Verrucomicrobiae bacterium]